jgi:uncharacterized membrane protein
VIVPNVLRWYWWRLNGWGYATGTLAGLALSVLQLKWPGLADWIAFPIIIAASLAASIVVSWLTAPVSPTVLIEFFRTVRPFGLWRPVRQDAGLSDADLRTASERPARTMINVALGMVVIAAAYLLPMYLVGHWYTHALVCLSLAVAGAILLKHTWYNHLPPVE